MGRGAGREEQVHAGVSGREGLVSTWEGLVERSKSMQG